MGCGDSSPEYIGSVTCGSCHSSEFAAWESSDHMRAMQLPSADNVLGDFDGAQFEHFSDAYTFIRTDSSYHVVANADTFDVAYTFGHEPLQQVLLTGERGRLQALTVAWDNDDKRWYSLYPDEPTPPGDELHWGSENLNWNYMCADCHSTGLTRGYDLESDTYDTKWAELSVGCEACHGPGGDHALDTAQAYGESRSGIVASRSVISASATGPVGRPNTDVLSAELNMCAQCHSRRSAAYRVEFARC